MRVSPLAAAVPLLFLAAVQAQTPATFTSYGSGCAGAAAPPALTALQPPILGRTFALAAPNLVPGKTGLLVLGSSDKVWGTTPLPLDLKFMNMPGCKLYVSWEAQVLFPSGPAGLGSWQIRVPYDTKLRGFPFFVQLWMPDAQANPPGIAVSNGGKAVIGDCICGPVVSMVESFQSAGMLDTKVSAGTWGGGNALPAQIGGTGIHGPFDPTIGVVAGPDPKGNPRPDTYIWNTDQMVIPGRLTETGQNITVTNGIFHFSEFYLPASVTVLFQGSNPVRINVRGAVQIDGVLQANAPAAVFFQAATTLGSVRILGQPSIRGGPGGGSGGQGGDACLNLGPNPPAGLSFNGQNGADVRLPAGSGYGTAVLGTGGTGSKLHPLTGVTGSYCALGAVFSGEIAAGGGGGGFHVAGGGGMGTQSPCTGTGLLGNNSGGGGKAFDIAALAPMGTSIDHYLAGGSGGGGGGSHPYLTNKQYALPWIPGSSGAGGGGAISIRVGQNLVMKAGSRIEAKGGDGYVVNGANDPWEGNKDILFNVPAPGGGGSGGTVYLQVLGTAVMGGSLDTSGGAAGQLDLTRAGQPALTGKSSAGAGAPGYVRLELPATPNPGQLGQTLPAAAARNTGKLSDQDVKVTSQSKFYSTGLRFAPEYLRYIVEVDLAGQRVVYSDDPTIGSPASAGKPLYFRIQGASLDPATGKPDPATFGPWRDFANRAVPAKTINEDHATEFRFQLVYDTSTVKNVTVKKVTIDYRQ